MVWKSFVFCNGDDDAPFSLCGKVLIVGICIGTVLLYQSDVCVYVSVSLFRDFGWEGQAKMVGRWVGKTSNRCCC